jgi:cell division protein ZapA (FtsZ GTPase activity inhibitor)
METVEAINLFDEYNKLKAENDRLREENYDLTLTFLLSKEKADDEIARLRDALSEAIEFADQDYHALTPTGETMISRWRSALQQKETE